jgi:hypothetical protein
LKLVTSVNAILQRAWGQSHGSYGLEIGQRLKRRPDWSSFRTTIHRPELGVQPVVRRRYQTFF